MSEENKDVQATAVSQEEYNKQLERARNFEAKFTDLEKKYNGIDPEKYKAIIEENLILKREGAGNDPKKIQEVIDNEKKEIERELVARYGAKFEEFQGKNSKLEQELKTLRVTNVAMGKAASVFNSDTLTLIQREIEDNCDHDGEKIIIKDKDGKPQYSKTNPKNLMEIDEYLQELANKYPSAAKAKSGTGARDGGTKTTEKSGEVTVEQYRNMTKEERVLKLNPLARAELARKSIQLSREGK